MKRFFLIIFLVVIFGTAFAEFPKNEKGNSSSGDLNPLFLTHTCVKELIGILKTPFGKKNAVSQLGQEPVELFLRYFGWVTETEPDNGLAILFADQMKILIGFKKTESITGGLEYFDSWTVVQRNSVIKLLKIFLEDKIKVAQLLDLKSLPKDKQKEVVLSGYQVLLRGIISQSDQNNIIPILNENAPEFGLSLPPNY